MGEIFRKEIKISLDDPASIQRAIDTINKLAEGIPKAMDGFCNYLVKKGVTIAKQQINALCSTPSGDLARSVRFELSDGGKGIAYVVAGYPFDHYSDNPKYDNVSYAVFVEFGYGTGSYYDTSGALVTEQKRIDRFIEEGEEPKYGRSEEHPSGNGRYRDADTYGVITSGTGEKFLGWKYYNRKTGQWSVSYGQNPKPFMYNTLLELARMAEQDAGTRLGLYMAGSL